MKRTLFILGILIILSLTGILIFLLFADEDTKKDIFSNFGLTGTEEGIGEAIIDFIMPDDVVANPPLRQLTLKPTIGMVEITSTASSTSPILYFVEAGTGHVFSLDITVGTEERLSNITIPTAQQAVVAQDGSTAIIGSDINQSGYKLTAVTLPKDTATLESYEISERAKDFSLTSDGNLLYSTVDGNALIGKYFDVETKTTSTLFTLPFREAIVLWGSEPGDSTYVYPKASFALEGYLYQLENSELNRLPISGFGLTAIAGSEDILYDSRSGDGSVSVIKSVTQDSSVTLSTPLIPEKCVFGKTSDVIICGKQTSDTEVKIDQWYQGVVTFIDDIWLMDPITGDQKMLISPLTEVGREIDIIKPTLSADDSRFYFINKNDRSPWLLDRSLLSE